MVNAPSASISLGSDAEKVENEEVMEFVLGCMLPLDQSNAAIVIPSPNSSACSLGSYMNQTLIEIEPALLGDKCSSCPTDSYMAVENDDFQCIACPMGSGTMGDSGATNCVLVEANAISTGLKVMRYLFVVTS